MQKSELKKFKVFLKNSQYDKKTKETMLNGYANYISGMNGSGAVRLTNGGKLVKHLATQQGAGWSDFTNWVKRSANKVKDGFTSVGNKIANVSKVVYKKALKPAGELAWKGIKKGAEYVKEKPLTSLKWVAKAAAKIAPPGVSTVLDKASDAIGTVADATGKGKVTKSGVVRMEGSGQVLSYY